MLHVCQRSLYGFVRHCRCVSFSKSMESHAKRLHVQVRLSVTEWAAAHSQRHGYRYKFIACRNLLIGSVMPQAPHSDHLQRL